MKSVIKVSSKVIAIKGSARLTDFRIASFKEKFQSSTSIDLKELNCNEIYFASLSDPNKIKDLKYVDNLCNILSAEESSDFLQEDYLLVIPRIGTISPWSSKATEILHNCGINWVDRIERGFCFHFGEQKAKNKKELLNLGKLLSDRMTQEVIVDVKETSSIFSSQKPGPFKEIDIFSSGLKELEESNLNLGLALNEDEIQYLYENYKETNSNPTDAELMMFAQANSEHCRHKIFNADWSIDGSSVPNSLFEMIRNTHKVNPSGVLSAYEDNAAILEGHESTRFYPKNGKYQAVQEKNHLVIKVETHNHPTAISPFSGAATGSGGEIRDEGATGVGAKPKAGLSGFTVSNLRIPNLLEDWEKDADSPNRIATPLEIMIEAPIGSAAFNNEFGRPNILGYFRSFEMELLHEGKKVKFGYHKPIMLAGGLGNIKSEHVNKSDVPIGSRLVVLGGPAMLIGLGGGSASSLSSGEGDTDLDFASVQRENPEMERRCQEVLDRCWQEEDNNPILFIHDVGAGGLSNAIPELVKDSGHGGLINLRDIPNAELGMTPMEIWCNESQERYVLAIDEESIETFTNFCLRERCPFSIVGEITKGNQLEVYDEHFDNYPISLSLDILFGKPPKSSRSFSTKKKDFGELKIPDHDLEELLFKVLRHPAVASKNFLITIGDRTVTGLINRDQLVGPWQVPVSDYAMTRSGFAGVSGEAMSIGERTPAAIINPAAAARISVAEAVTNILPSGISKLSDVKLSANWMGSPEKLDGDQDLYEAVEAIGMGLCPQWEIAIPVGKDSLSMSTEWEDKGKNKSVTSPLSLIISAFTAIKDINLSVTPQLIDKESELILIDLSKGSCRLGSSIASQVNSLFGGDVPDVECIKEMPNFVNTIHNLLKDKKILSYHDRSDGGLITTAIEMAFAGRLGIDIKLDLLPSNSKEIVADLFNEELGVVIQVAKEDKEIVMRALDSCSLRQHSYAFGVLNQDKDIKLISENKITHHWSLKTLLKEWHKVSYEIQSLRDNPETAKSEYFYDIDSERTGIKPSLSFEIPSNFSINKTKPRLAILREQGINGQVEMAAAFDRVGFDCIDVHMTDLISGDSLLNDFQGLVACGGFSYGDVLGAGGGWATNILYNQALKDQFQQFFSNEEVFSLGICNGCQTLSLLSSLIPGTDAWPRFKRNNSEKFEARLSQVLIKESPSIFFKDMAGSLMPIPVAHGEGRAELSDEDFSGLISENLNPIVYSDDEGQSTESYPENPNGSPSGIAGVTNKSGRVTIMMPHPERAFLTSQYSWHPKDWEEYGPWIKFFDNAKDFVS